MVILLTGENSYQAAEEIRRLEVSLGIAPERVDVDTLDQAKLADLMKGASLFAEKRLVVIDELSSRADLWNQAAEWVGLVGGATTLVLREPKPDKRTKAYKIFAKEAKLVEAVSWTERQSGLAEKWLATQATASGVSLSSIQIRNMVARALVPGQKQGQRVIDQTLLARALEALVGATEVTDDMIATVMPESTSDAVFDLLEIAVRGDAVGLHQRLDDLRTSQDGFQLFALVSTQWAQLVMIALTRGEAVADIHPFVQQKLRALTGTFSPAQLRSLTQLAATLDIQLKSTALDPWDAVARLLFGIAHRN